MSSSFLKPSVTPRTALATRLRARPWNLPSSGSSRSVVARQLIAVDRRSRCPAAAAAAACPSGPWTSTAPGLTSILTPFGIAIGFLPIRDMLVAHCSSFQLSALSVTSSVICLDSWQLAAGSCLPHVTEHFAADAGLDRLAAGHHAARRRQDAGAEAGEHVGDLVATEVDAAAGTADALDAGDDALAARAVLQEQRGAAPAARSPACGSTTLKPWM